VLVSVAVAITIFFIRHVSQAYGRKHTLPPGPPPDPIIGHLRQIPTSSPWLKFAEWCKTYGEIVYVNVLGKPMIILGTLSAARELMETRGANYSDRPRAVLQGEM
jgi:hypothetical protein